MGRARGGVILLCAALAAMLLCADYAQAARVSKSIDYGALEPGGRQCFGHGKDRHCRKIPSNHYKRGCHGRCRGGKKEKDCGNNKPGLETDDDVVAAYSPALAPSPGPAPTWFLNFWRA